MSYTGPADGMPGAGPLRSSVAVVDRATRSKAVSAAHGLAVVQASGAMIAPDRVEDER